MRRVLIVSPRFVPTNAADMHRVRQSLPYLEEFGWEPVVLAVDPRWCDQPTDELLSSTIPDKVRVRRVTAIDQRLTKRFGLGDLALRAYRALRKAGDDLLGSERFDLVFFSTTAFGVLPLGRAWKRRFGVPFAIDLQDPWLSDYYDRPGAPRPPGGRLKYALAQARAHIQERATLRDVAHVVTVSAAYPSTLMTRYGWLRPEQFTVLPFGAAAIDFDVLERSSVRQGIFDPWDGSEHWVYVGRAGGDMDLALEALFTALARARAEEPSRYNRVRLHFVGTTYATDARAVEAVAPIASRCGVGDLVREHPRRIPYFETLTCLQQAHVLVVPGSDDPGYTASKIYPYVLSRRPLLAIFHEESSVAHILRECRAGTVVTFRSGETATELSRKVAVALSEGGALARPDTDWDAFARYSSREMTRALCAAFDRAIRPTSPRVRAGGPPDSSE